jgi:hypothetical protein
MNRLQQEDVFWDFSSRVPLLYVPEMTDITLKCTHKKIPISCFPVIMFILKASYDGKSLFSLQYLHRVFVPFRRAVTLAAPC